MSGKGKKIAKQKNKMPQSASVSSSSSSASSSQMVAKVELSHFDENFGAVEFLAEHVESAVNMKVYAHGSWCAIEKVLAEGFVTPEQRVYFENHLNGKGDVDIIALFDDNVTGNRSSIGQLTANEQIIFKRLERQKECHISRVDHEKMLAIRKYFRFQVTYGHTICDFDLAIQDANDHSLSPASVMYDKNRNIIFGKKNDHFSRHKRFISHQEISMPGLEECYSKSDTNDHERIRKIGFAIKTALFYINSSQGNGYYLDETTVKLLKNFRANKFWWKDIKSFYKLSYYKKDRVAEKIEEAFDRIMEASKGRDMMCLRERQEWLTRVWKQYRLIFCKTMYLIDEINEIKKDVKIAYPFSPEVIEACQPQPSNVSYDEQVEILFQKIQLLKTFEKESEKQYQHYLELWNDRASLVEVPNSSPDLSATSSRGSSENKNGSKSSESPSKNKKKTKKKEEKKKDSDNDDDDFDQIIKEAQAANALYQKKQDDLMTIAKEKMYQTLLMETNDSYDINEKMILSQMKRDHEKIDEKLAKESIQKAMKENQGHVQTLNAISRRAGIYETDMALCGTDEVPEQFFYEVMNELLINAKVPDCENKGKTFSISHAYFNEESEHKKKTIIIKEFVEKLETATNNYVAIHDEDKDKSRVKLVLFFLKKFKELKFVIRHVFHLDPMTFMKENNKVNEEIQETRELLQSFLLQYREKNDADVLTSFLTYSKDIPVSNNNKMRAFMFVLFTHVDYGVMTYSDVIDLYVAYINKEMSENDCFNRRDSDIDYVKTCLRTACELEPTRNRFEVIKNVVQTCYEGSERSINQDRIMCAVFEECQSIADSNETLDRLMPEYFRTGLHYHEADRNQTMASHPSIIANTLPAFIANNALFSEAKNTMTQYCTLIAYLKGVLLLSERAYFRNKDEKKSNKLLNQYKYFYFLITEVPLNCYIVQANICETKELRKDDERVSRQIEAFVAEQLASDKTPSLVEWKTASMNLIEQVQNKYVHFDLNRMRLLLMNIPKVSKEMVVWFDLSLIHYMVKSKIVAESAIVYPVTDTAHTYRIRRSCWLFISEKQDNKMLIPENDFFLEGSDRLFSEAYHSIRMMFSPFLFFTGFYDEVQSDAELNRFIDIIFTYSALLMLNEKRNDFKSVVTMCGDFVKSLEAFAYHQFYLEKFKNKKPVIKDVEFLLAKTIRFRELYSQSLRRLIQLYLTLPMDKIVNVFDKRLKKTDDRSELLDHKNFFLTYAITTVHMREKARLERLTVDVTDMFSPYQFLPSIFMYQSLQSVVLQLDPPMKNSVSVILLDVFSTYLSRVDPKWCPLSSMQEEIQWMYDMGVMQSSFKAMKEFLVNVRVHRSYILKTSIYFLKVKDITALNDVFPDEFINKLLDFPEVLTAEDVDFISHWMRKVTESVLQDVPNLPHHPQFNWEADYIHAIYLMKVDQYVTRTDFTIEERRKNLRIIRQLYEYWQGLQDTANKAKMNDPSSPSAVTTIPFVILGPMISQMKKSQAPASALEAPEVKKISKVANRL